MANPMHSSGPFDEYIYRLIVEASLDGWTPEGYFGKRARHVLLNRNELDARRNLARYCRVNREWRDIAERLLYAAPTIGKPSVCHGRPTMDPQTSSMSARGLIYGHLS